MRARGPLWYHTDIPPEEKKYQDLIVKVEEFQRPGSSVN